MTVPLGSGGRRDILVVERAAGRRARGGRPAPPVATEIAGAARPGDALAFPFRFRCDGTGRARARVEGESRRCIPPRGARERVAFGAGSRSGGLALALALAARRLGLADLALLAITVAGLALIGVAAASLS